MSTEYPQTVPRLGKTVVTVVVGRDASVVGCSAPPLLVQDARIATSDSVPKNRRTRTVPMIPCVERLVR